VSISYFLARASSGKAVDLEEVRMFAKSLM
jgi:hypothetical protein